MKKISIRELPQTHQEELRRLAESHSDGAHKLMPLYYRHDDEIKFVSDFGLPEKANRDFEKLALTDTYRGGISAMVMTDHGVLSFGDDRYSWLRTFGGIAKFEEGQQLSLTAGRELEEEAFVFTLDHSKRYVPQGFSAFASAECSLGFTAKEIVEAGKLVSLGHTCNEKNRAYEAMFIWDLSGAISEKFSVTAEEDWFRGGHSGTTLLTIDNFGRVSGFFSGQQGYFPLFGMGVHEVFEKMLGLKAGGKDEGCSTQG